MALNSQLERLEKGEVTLEEMDFYYFKKLGIKGKQTLVELKARAQAEQKLIVVKKIDRLLADKKEITSLSKPELLSGLKGNVDINTIPQALSEQLYEDLNQKKSWENTNTQYFYLFKLSLNLGAGNKAEYLLVKELEQKLALQVYFLENSIWEEHRMQTKNLPAAQEMFDAADAEIEKANKNNEENKKLSEKALQIQSLIKQNYKTVKPKWQQLEINGQRFEVME